MDEIGTMASNDQPAAANENTTENAWYWYCVVDSNGDAYRNMTATTIEMSPGDIICDFRVKIRAANPNALNHTDPSRLTVYRNKDSWDNKIENTSSLDASDNQDQDLKDEEGSPLGSSCKLAGLGKDKEDALIVVVLDCELKRRKLEPPPQVSWQLQDRTFPRNIPLPFKLPDLDIFSKEISPNNDEIETDSLFTIEPKYHEVSGLAPHQSKPQDLVLHCRRAFRYQAGYLEKYAIRCPALCWVVGPPGSGISCAAFAFALSLDPCKWNVIWIHYYRARDLFKCVRFEGDKKQTRAISSANLASDMRPLVDAEQPTGDKRTIIFLDGYIRAEQATRGMWSYCSAWSNADKDRHRMVTICSKDSLANRFALSHCRFYLDHTIAYADSMEWESWSWSLEEYLAAVQNDKLFHSVKEDLASAGQQQRDRAELVKSKFPLAGGNVGFMFGWQSKFLRL